MISFGRDVCGNPEISEKKEWLVTNGIGGYASGTLAGMPTRSYHGLLIAALQPPTGRTLLLSKLDETVIYDSCEYPLYCTHWASGDINPQGYRFLDSFHLEGMIPVWKYSFGDAQLEKRVWMQPGHNTTYIQYRYVSGGIFTSALRPIFLSIQALVNYRDHHAVTQYNSGIKLIPEAAQNRLSVAYWAPGSKVENPPDDVFFILSDRGEVEPREEWSVDYFLSVEAYRGLKTVDDHFIAGKFSASLLPGDFLTIVASSETGPNVDGEKAYRERLAYERKLLEIAGLAKEPNGAQVELDARSQLVLAADQFIVERASRVEPRGSSIIAGYPWFGDWGRDTMISLPGLTLATGRPQVARRILRTYASFIDQGMLPNRFPDLGEIPEYNTVDAALWYFEALRAYLEEIEDDRLLQELFPLLDNILSWYQNGTRFGIRVDPEDGLLTAGEPGIQLTWMDAKVGDWVVTPRAGKPVEINALWYNALRIMEVFAGKLDQPAQSYCSAAERVETSFERFWNPSRECLYDVLDGPEGNDPSLRPNQIFTVSLPFSPLPAERQRAVVDTCARSLLTAHGLRSLGLHEPGYLGTYGGDQFKRDSAYHQGTVWGWLLGPFVSAHLRVYQNPEMARNFLHPMIQHLSGHGIGSLSEIFDGDPPFQPRGCIAQAWTVAETLRALREIEALERIVV